MTAPSELKRGLFHTLSRLWETAKAHRGCFVAAGCAMLLTNLASFLRPYLLKRLTDDVLTAQSLAGKTNVLLLLLSGVLGATAMKGLFTYLQGYWLTTGSQRLARDLRDRLYAHVLRLPLSWFDESRVGDLIVRFTSDLRVVTEFINGGLSILVNDCIVIVSSLTWMVSADWQLTIVGMVITPAAGIIVRRFSKRMTHATESAQKTLSDLSNVVKETVEGIKVVKAFNREHYESQRFSERSRDSFRWAMRMVQLTATQSPLLEVLGTVGIALVLWYCAVNVMSGRLTLGDLLAFWGYMLLAMTPINRMAGTMQLITRGEVATARVFEILDCPEQEARTSEGRELATIEGRISFEDVHFRYNALRDEALRGVTATIEPGHHVAVVGRNGAGKSTLVNLVPRFYEVTSGRILIDGQPISEVSLQSLRRQIAVVPQDTFLFSGTVRDNIRYGRPTATDDEVEAAAQVAGAHGFITAMELGYDTPLQECGRNLSGGQRQRLAIARVVLRDPVIVILDEATSSLDPNAERAIQETLHRATAGKTVINIVHRLTLAQAADHIIVLDEGRVVEQGRHADLLALRGTYWELYRPLLEASST